MSRSNILNPVVNILFWPGLPKMVGKVIILKMDQSMAGGT